ncbi:phospholipid phosphatase 5 [Schistocerca piceifrons]|nr:phospholipid phosphatase 5 [Schistocerca piceifrons]XP_049785360.1 phospholipid phosphatase 5 [Schistocerca cancellata]XP_049809524.1 phospholipid phosphatase 5-like isoform X1 [Schistocerca nitens]XP_049829856.1 phospholipid phosphatase 5 [Schistocerca gregaria]XP_049951171.1 phospholipid phosphatase 5 isoform X1 [Schistocerca serialis cubense]
MADSRENSSNLFVEVIVRVVLALIFIELEGAKPFSRKIHPDELWLYKNPRSESYVPVVMLWPLVFITPAAVIFAMFLLQRDKIDVCQAVLSLTLGLSLNGALTNMIKLIVGRPRPDFFWRCFPDGEVNPDLECTGDESVVWEGRKSFPSGHSSFSFASMGFVAFYLAGKLHVFTPFGRGRSWRLCIFLAPLTVATCVALSRTCDYHHHWQDVLCGSLLGLSISYLCYRQYYPSLDSLHAHRPYVGIIPYLELDAVRSTGQPRPPEEQVKWI